MLQAKNLQTEYKVNPIGVDEEHPRFFYQLSGDSCYQSARRIKVTCECGEVVWDSGFVPCSSTIQIVYEGGKLKPHTRYFWQVCVQDEDGTTGDWSEEAYFETGFLGTPWQAKWICADEANENMRSVKKFRRDFSCAPGKKVKKARLYATALGLYNAFINGKKVGEDLLTPGWTNYYDRVQYQAYDVTGMLEDGNNAWCFQLGEGWYCGRISRIWTCFGHTYGGFPELLAELHITYDDGTQEILTTGPDFLVIMIDNDGLDLIRYSDLYMGEYYVTGRNGTKWLDNQTDLFQVCNCNDGISLWGRIRRALCKDPENPVRITWQSGAPARIKMDVAPVKIWQRANGNWLIDFGQNLAGHERIRLKNVLSGTMITIRHGEMLQQDGSLYTDNLRSAMATTMYRAQNDLKEVDYEPTFTNYGFRYLEITGWPVDQVLTAENITARVVYSDLESTGSFSCSEPLLNQLYSNTVWGQRANFLDVPTDCPQRDERLGWTADTQIFANTATYNMYAPEFFTKWLEDLNTSITPQGVYPEYAPKPYKCNNSLSITGWSEAGLICPWIMYQKYADTRIIGKYYDIMNRFQKTIAERGSVKPHLFDTKAWTGDWLNLNDPTSSLCLSTTYYAGMEKIMAHFAELLGKKDDVEYHQNEYTRTAAAFAEEFFDAEGNMKEKSQTALLLALHFECVPERFIRKTVDALVKNLKEHDVHLSTGFLGAPLVLPVLARYGEIDLAYDLLFQKTYPGWLYPVLQGATTVWERWNSYTIKDGFGNVEMNSFNHYAYGAVCEWFYETICGIKTYAGSGKDAGFRHFRLAPVPGNRLTEASASYLSICGEIRSAWKKMDNRFIWDFTVPCNTKAEIIPPYDNMPETRGIAKDVSGKWIAKPGSYHLTFEF